jgi:hypothetical protein
MPSALEMVFAEMTVKDLASPNLKKISDAAMKDAKALGEAEKAATKAQSAFSKISSFFSGKDSIYATGGSAIMSINSSAQGMAQAIGSGSGFHQAISQIHLVGPYLAAAITAMHTTAQMYVAGVNQERTDQIIKGNYQRAFANSTKTNIEALQDGMFRAKDAMAAMTSLRDMGVSEKAITESGSTLARFAKSQGLGSAQEAVQALVSGNIKQGRGVEDPQIQVIKQAVTQMGKSGASADVIFRYVVGILNDQSKTMDMHAAAFKATAGSAIRTVGKIQDAEEGLVKRGGRAQNAAAYWEGLGFRRAEQDLTTFAGRNVGGAINATKNALMSEGAGKIGRGAATYGKMLIGDFKGAYEDLTGKATGGPVRRGQSYVVGERRPEVFTPSQTGTIIPNMPSGGRGGNTYNINVYANEGDGHSIAQKVKETIENLARGEWRINSGLRAAM